MMDIEVHLYSQSAPVIRKNARNAYQKGDMYCVMDESGNVEKYPLMHIFRVVERAK